MDSFDDRMLVVAVVVCIVALVFVVVEQFYNTHPYFVVGQLVTV